jgi:hypothetical protein
MADPTAPERHDPPTENACRVERDYGSGIIHVCEWTAGRCSDTHSCGCGLVWTATAPVPAEDLRDRIERWRSTADLDSRAGAPVGNALHDACNEVERLQARLAEEVAVSGLLARRAEASEGEHGVTREREAEQRRRAELAEQASAEWQAACEAHAADSERLADGVLALEAERDALKAERECTQQFLRTLIYTADVLAILDAPESPTDARTPVTAATDAHGGAGEAQEAAQ